MARNSERRTILFVLLAVAGSFGIGLLIAASRFYQTAPLSQFEQWQAKLSGMISATASKQKSGASKSSMLLGSKPTRAKTLNFRVPTQFEGAVVYQAKMSGPAKVIALTFDDGPWNKTTEQVLDILQQKKVKATFFWVGAMVERYPQLARRVVADGHAVGNHTWHHWFRRMDGATSAHEIDDTAALIYKTTGVTTAVFRPPGGILYNGVADYAKKKKYVIAMWSVDTVDYRHPPASTLVSRVLTHATPGGVVLMHDGGGNRSATVEALPQIIDGLKEHGYQLVTVPELLEMQNKYRVTTVAKFTQGR